MNRRNFFSLLAFLFGGSQLLPKRNTTILRGGGDWLPNLPWDELTPLEYALGFQCECFKSCPTHMGRSCFRKGTNGSVIIMFGTKKILKVCPECQQGGFQSFPVDLHELIEESNKSYGLS